MNRVQGKQGKSEEDENLSESGKQKEPELKLETEVKTVSSVDKDSETPSILKGEDASSPSALKKTEEEVLDEGMCQYLLSPLDEVYPYYQYALSADPNVLASTPRSSRC